MNGLVQPDHRADTLHRYRLINTTTYHFDDAQASCELDIRLAPRSDHYQSCEHHGLIVRPLPRAQAERLDRHHNTLTRVMLEGELHRLTLSAVSEVTMRERGPRWSQLTEPWSHCIVAWSEALSPEVMLYRPASEPLLESVRTFASSIFTPGRALGSALRELSKQLSRFAYRAPRSRAVLPAEETLRLRAGCCADRAQLAVICLRAVGMAARYVGGYLLAEDRDLAEGRNAQSSQLHAWPELWLPDERLERGRWLGFDPTLGAPLGARHLAVAQGGDAADVATIEGIAAAGSHRCEVSIRVHRIP